MVGCGTSAAGFRRAAVAVAALALPACGTPGVATLQEVTVHTPGCIAARCELSNDQGSWRIAPTPGTVLLTTSHAPLKVVCSADRGFEGHAAAASSMGTTPAQGAVVGGVVGAGVGAAVAAPAAVFFPPAAVVLVIAGAAAGAGTGQVVESQRRAIRYPETITVPMDCTAAVPDAPPPGFGLEVRGLTPAEARSAGLGGRSAVLITAVEPGSAAAAADLRAGDVVVAADGRPVSDAAMLERALRAVAPGARIALAVMRGAEPLQRMLRRPEVAR